MSAAKGCCWAPPLLSGYFSCCAPLGCCGTTAGPTPAPTAPAHCTDEHAECARLKSQLDSIGKSCFTDDIGEGSGTLHSLYFREPKHMRKH